MDWYEEALKNSEEQGWLDRSGSRNRLNGLEEVRKKMPKEMQVALPPLIIFSPALDTGGATYRREVPLSHAFVYLSPTLEKERCVNATWAVAHELAHVVLGHGLLRQRKQAEVEADEKAATELADKWVPNLNPKQSRCLKLIEKGEEAFKLESEKFQEPEA